MKKNRILNILIILMVVLLVGVFFCVQYSDHKNKKLKEEQEIINAEKLFPTDDNAVNVMTYSADSSNNENLVLAHSDFSQSFKRTSFFSGETSVEYRFSKTLFTSENLYLLKFKMNSEKSSVKMTVSFGDEHVFYVTPTLHEYAFPCSSAEINKIKWILELDEFQKVFLYDVEVIKYSKNGLNFTKLEAGTYTVPEIEKYDFAEDGGIGVGKTMDVTGDGQYLYSAGDSRLTISQVTNSETNVISTLDGIGNIRHIKLKDDKTLAVASRENGVLLISIEDKNNPYILSRYDSLEIANDVCFSGDYMFVAGRYFGIEIVDISDLSKPVLINKIVNGEECFRCTVEEEYLFVGCWSSGMVEIYNISNLLKPTLVSSVSVDGRCAGIFVEDSYLYVASGYMGNVNSKDIGDIGYATGNGVAIFDISDIEYPKWCSTIKAEGSLYGNGYDDWTVQVSDGYLYFTNSFGGMYIYNIKDITAPVNIANVRVPLYPSSDNFVDYSKSPNYVFPYDVKEFILSPAMGVFVDNGCVFIANAYTDVYKYDFEHAKLNQKVANEFSYELVPSSVVPKEEYKTYLQDKDVYAIVMYDDSSYVLGTAEGLVLTDKDFSVIDSFATENPVKDLKVSVNNLIVTAEKYNVSTYKIENNRIVLCGSVASEASNANVSALEITGDGKFAIVQSSWTRIEAVNLSDIENPTLVKNVISVNGSEIPFSNVASPGNMYYKNILNGTSDGKVGVGASKNFVLFESKNDKLTVSNSFPNRFAYETNGSAVINEEGDVLNIYNNGYVVYNPSTLTDQDAKALTRYYVPNLRIKGKPSAKNGVLVATNAPNGWIYILDISDVSSPYLMAYYETEKSIGHALIQDDFILIPARHGGIIKINLYY